MKILTKFDIWYRKRHIFDHAYIEECGRPKIVKEMTVRIFTMLSVARLLATALFI